MVSIMHTGYLEKAKMVNWRDVKPTVLKLNMENMTILLQTVQRARDFSNAVFTRKGCLPKKKSVWRENVPTGGEGSKKTFKIPNKKYLFTWELFQGGQGVKSLFNFSFQNMFLVQMSQNV